MTTFFIIALLIIISIIGIIFLLRYLKEIDETNKKIKWAEKRHYTLLKVLVPKNNTKSPLAAEQMFASLHGIYRKAEILQEHFSFEIAATSQSINFYLLVPTHLRDFIEGQVYSQYPTVEIEAVSDYANVPLEGQSLVGADIMLTKNDYFPIRTFANFDVDPLAGITGVLSKIDDGELLSIQAVMSPIDDSWQKEGLDYVKKVKEGQSVAPPPPLHVEFGKQGMSLIKEFGKDMVGALVGGGGEDKKKEDKKEVRLSGPEDAALKAIETKVTKLGFAVTIRVMAITKDEALSHTRVQSVVGAFKQFNLTNMNGFDIGAMHTDPAFLRTFRSRNLSDTPFRLNTEEIASLFHYPDMSVETPNIVWAGSKKGEPPQNLPIEGEVATYDLTSFGLTSFRNRRAKFGIKAEDRRLHFYIIGKTGTGKSTLIENMIYDDIKEGRGVAVVDPHGELIEHILNFIPDDRINDVVYFNPDDREHPLAFNLLESVESDMRSVVASGLMSIFTKLWANVWSARMEYILRNAILAVLEVPNATLLSIMRVLNDPIYRKYVMAHVTDPVVKDFFFNEYDKYDAKFRQEAIAPIQNKVGQFLSSSTVRNIVGQPKSTFNLSDIMDSGKIFLVDLSIGKIGEDNSKLLGSMIITKIQLAAMGRARIAPEKRKDFYLYVDEFQNFATDSFATILSEARKYKLNLVLANQYIAQIPEVVADAIFGNVGTMVSFRVGPTDADKLVKEFAPVFEANDLINLPNRQIYVKMAIDGVTSQAFSAHTLPPRGVVANNTDAIIDQSRRKYSRSRAEVEQEINDSAQADYRPESEKEHEDLRQHPYIIDGTLYKEFSAKGGQRWYFGQPPDALANEERQLLGLPPLESETEAVSETKDEPPDVAVPEPEKTVQPEPEPEAIIPAPTTAELPAPMNADEIKLPAPSVAEPATELIAFDPSSGTIVPAHEHEADEQPKKRKRKRNRKKKNREAEASESMPMAAATDTELVGQGSREEKGEERPVSPVEVAVKSPVAPNRGHQHDDWLPLDEL